VGVGGVSQPTQWPRKEHLPPPPLPALTRAHTRLGALWSCGRSWSLDWGSNNTVGRHTDQEFDLPRRYRMGVAGGERLHPLTHPLFLRPSQVHASWRLNERMYGALTGLDKKETVAKYGSEQVRP
jgi:hypothetical protein